MKKILKYIFIALIIVIFIYIILAYVKYPDKTSYIKPVALELLHKSQALDNKEDKLLSKDEVIELLQESGCYKVYKVESSITKTKIKGVNNESIHWFSGMCMTKENKVLDVRITLHEKHIPNFAIYFEHSHCHSVLGQSIDCFTQSITEVPSR